MKKLILFLLFLLSLSSFTQNTINANYYVTANSLNVRSGASIDSTQIFKLKQYDNIELIDNTKNWARIEYQGKAGYVARNFIKKGRAEVSVYYIRTGAVCRDGTRSSATGRGACSHHGGVSYWLKDERKSVNVVYD